MYSVEVGHGAGGDLFDLSDVLFKDALLGALLFAVVRGFFVGQACFDDGV